QNFVGRSVLVSQSQAGSNTAIVTGPGSSWIGNGEMNVGSFSDNNLLVISNGAFVATGNGFVGRVGNSNLAVVTDPGTLWNIGSMTLQGTNNLLVVSNQAVVVNGNPTSPTF